MKWVVRASRRRTRTEEGKKYYSYVMTIPKAVARALGIEKGTPLEIMLMPDRTGFVVRVVRDGV